MNTLWFGISLDILGVAVALFLGAWAADGSTVKKTMYAISIIAGIAACLLFGVFLGTGTLGLLVAASGLTLGASCIHLGRATVDSCNDFLQRALAVTWFALVALGFIILGYSLSGSMP